MEYVNTPSLFPILLQHNCFLASFLPREFQIVRKIIFFDLEKIVDVIVVTLNVPLIPDTYFWTESTTSAEAMKQSSNLPGHLMGKIFTFGIALKNFSYTSYIV